MKQVRNFLAIAIIAATVNTTVYAAPTTVLNIEEPIELRLLGNYQNQPILALQFTEANANQEFSVVITDESGYVFYNGTVNSSKKTRQFVLNTEDLGNTTVTFNITSKTTGQKISYQVKVQETTTQITNLVKL